MENITQGQWFRGPSADLGDTIAQSLRFNAGGYLTRAQTSTGDGLISSNRTFTFSTWIKLGQFGSGDAGEHNIFGIHHSSNNENWLISLSSETFSDRHNEGGSSSFRAYDTTAKFRDPHAWYHLFLTYSSNVGTLRVNNVLMDTARGQSSGMDRDFWIGSEANGGSPMQAHLAETYFIQGTAMNAVNDGFIRLNEDGVYVPSTPTISSYGTNGFHLTYDSSQTNGVGHDSSGNGNHFTATGFDTTAISSSNKLNDIDVADTPTSNYATFNPLWYETTPSLKGTNMELNTAQKITGQASFRFPVGTTGKYWVEAGTASYTGNLAPAIMVTDQLDADGLSDTAWSTTANYSSIGGYDSRYSNFTGGSSYATYTDTGPTVALGINFDDEEVLMYNGGSLINTDTTVDFTKELAVTVMQPTTSYNTYDPYLNAGQQTFIQSPPTGYKALQTNNLPEPTIKNGKEHFGVVTYTGNSTDSNSITGLEFQPDLVWIKPRNLGDNHRLVDSVIGASTGHLITNSTDGKSATTVLESFDSNGFTLDNTDHGWNSSSYNYVAWCWKAGGAPTATNDNAAGTAQDAGSVKVDGSDGSFAQGSIAVKKMSVNTTAGFSIVEYQGTGSAGTIPHGLGAVPEFAIFKRHDGTSSWEIYHKGVGNTKALQFTDAGEQSASSTFWNNTSPTSTLFSLGGGGNNNTSGEQVISYIWTPIAGYSKFGDYDANGDENGPFVYTGFRPAFVLIKRRDSSYGGEWSLFDTARSDHNPAKLLLGPDRLNSERTDLEFDFLSNGFKIRVIGDWQNVSGGNYIYAAFAENPFGGANTPPATAR